jgi:hypothetical protein
MQRYQILDADLQSEVVELTDYQLVGVLVEKTKYPPFIYEKVKRELANRKIVGEVYADLERQYQAVELITPRKIPKGIFVLLILLNLSFGEEIISSFQILAMIIVVIFVNRKLEYGIVYEKKLWRNFNITLIILTFISIALCSIL